MGDSLFGSTTTAQSLGPGSIDPTLSALWGLRYNLANQTAAGGLPSAMSGYINNILVPTATNTATASGLGRSGAMTESVSNATLGYGTDFLKSLLSGIPSPYRFGLNTQTGTQSAGGLDFMNLIGGGLGLLGGLLGGSGGTLGAAGSALGSGITNLGDFFGNLFSSNTLNIPGDSGSGSLDLANLSDLFSGIDPSLFGLI